MLNKKLNLLLTISLLTIFSFSACRMSFRDSELSNMGEKYFSIEKGKELQMDVAGSDIIIKTWNKPEVYVKVLGNKKARRDADIRYYQDEDKVKIVTENDNNFSFFGNNFFLKFEIFVPDSFNTDLRTSGGVVDIYAINGSQKLRTSGGDVILENITGPVNAHTSGGTISGNNIKGDSRVHTSGGDVVYKNFTGDLDASTSGGTIVLKGSDSRINASTSGGDIRLAYKGENKGIDLRTSGGTIEMKLPNDFNAEAKLTTSGGNIDCNFPHVDINTVTDHKLEGKFNKGGNLIIAKTSGGDIRVN